MPVLAALATIPGREEALAVCLASLRPQVDQLRVVCHDMADPPAAVRALADAWVCEPDRAGSAAKLRWSQEWTGLYLACDDDLAYPPDYVSVMWRWVKRWRGRALVTCHGRVLKPGAREFQDHEGAWPPRGETPGRWINYPGGCAMAWDTRLRLPAAVPGRNLEEAHLASWAQLARVPIWLVPHKAEWLRWLLTREAPSIWGEESRAGFRHRAEVLGTHHDFHGPWEVHRA